MVEKTLSILALAVNAAESEVKRLIRIEGTPKIGGRITQLKNWIKYGIIIIESDYSDSGNARLTVIISRSYV